MKRHMVALFALAATLAFAPTAFGDVFSFTFSSADTTPNCCGINVIATGTLIGTEIVGHPGDYQITSGTITITGAISATGVIDTSVNPPLSGYCLPSCQPAADNTLYFIGNGPLGRYLDAGGLLFSTTVSGSPNNLWGGNNDGYGTSYSLSYHTWDIDYPGIFTVSAPDGGMTMMLLGGALVGLETLRRRFRA